MFSPSAMLNPSPDPARRKGFRPSRPEVLVSRALPKVERADQHLARVGDLVHQIEIAVVVLDPPEQAHEAQGARVGPTGKVRVGRGMRPVKLPQRRRVGGCAGMSDRRRIAVATHEKARRTGEGGRAST
jgi:hypothetical protein